MTKVVVIVNFTVGFGAKISLKLSSVNYLLQL